MANKTYAKEWLQKAYHDLDSANILFVSPRSHSPETVKELTLFGTDGLPSVGECLKVATLWRAHSEGRAIASYKRRYFSVSPEWECR